MGSEGGGGHGPMVAEARFAGEGKGIGANDLANLGCLGFGGGRTRGGGRAAADVCATRLLGRPGGCFCLTLTFPFQVLIKSG